MQGVYKMNELREHYKRKFSLSDEDYNTLVGEEVVRINENENSIMNILKGKVSELEKGVGTGGKSGQKGISQRLDDIESRITSLETK